MGMDVYGRKPKNQDGEYFRANVWGWRPILSITRYAIEKNDLDFDTGSWGVNDGGGLKGPRDCKKLAKALDDIISQFESNSIDEELANEFEIYKHHEYGICIDYKPSGHMLVDQNGRFVDPNQVTKNNTVLRSPYGTSVERLKEWSTFLKNCGGFRIC